MYHGIPLYRIPVKLKECFVIGFWILVFFVLGGLISFNQDSNNSHQPTDLPGHVHYAVDS